MQNNLYLFCINILLTMSTRSGKRIHSSPQGEINNEIEAIRYGIKSRSKCMKNKDFTDEHLTEKKRKKHYVRYPSDEKNDNSESNGKSDQTFRKSRRNTLKERNADITAEETEIRHTMKTTRKTKRCEEPDDNHIALNVAEDACEKRKKNKKKKKTPISIENKMHIDNDEAGAPSKKKTNKKKNKKKSSSITVEEVVEHPKMLNASGTSVDSFHSAAGSPKYEENCEESNMREKKSTPTQMTPTKIKLSPGVNNPSNKKGHINNVSCNQLNGHTSSDEQLETRNLRKRKSSISTSKNVEDEGTVDHDTKQSKSIGKKKRKLSNPSFKSGTTFVKEDKIINCTFDKEFKLNGTFEKDNKTSSTFNKNTTFDAVDVSNTTFDKEDKLKRNKTNNTIDRDDKANNTFDMKNNTNTALDKKDQSNITFDRNGERNSFEMNCKDTFDEKDKTNTTSDKEDKTNSTFNKQDRANSTFDKKDKTNTTLDKEDKTNSIVDKEVRANSTFNKDKANSIFDKKNKTNTTFDKEDIDNSIFDKEDRASIFDKKNRTNTTFDKEDRANSTFDKKDRANTTFDKEDRANSTFDQQDKTNTTFDMEDRANNSVNKRTSANSNFDKKDNINTTFDKEDKINTTFDKDNTFDENHEANTTFDKKDKANSTFDKSGNTESAKKRNIMNNNIANENLVNKKRNSIRIDKRKSEENIILLSLDNISNDNSNESLLTSDTSKSSHISVTSDESQCENILNNTPVLVESSMEEENICKTTSPTPRNVDTTTPFAPLKREGTFTKDSPEPKVIAKNRKSVDKTPTRRKSLPSPGCTPFPLAKSLSRDKSILNVTRSIEKSRRSSIAEMVPRATKVMFCSPSNNPTVVSAMKGKIIKSSLKGSNKSFIFDDNSCSSPPRVAGRKRSQTADRAAGPEPHAKRSRLVEPPGPAATASSPRPPRLRTRTLSASAKLPEMMSEARKDSPARERVRTRLPNFAALHARQFARMESLDECQRRRAERARLLLTPTGPVAVDRLSPKENQAPKQSEPNPPRKTETPTKNKPQAAAAGYSRFGFKLQADIAGNPFSFTASKTAAGARPAGARAAAGLKRQATMPSLAGTTRKQLARQAVMREKSFAGKRDDNRQENRTVIKGVRTNRRFELQMRMRNINT